MPITDRYGLPVSAGSAVAAERYQDGVDRLLAYEADADRAFAASLEADPDLALAHAGLALLAFFAGDGAGAQAAIGRAGERVAAATRRERQHVEALAALIGGDTARGLSLVDEHLREFPRDAVLANQASSAIGFSGRADREAYRTEFLEALQPAYGDDWWFQSALGFVYHEVGRFAESRRLSERSLAQRPGNANASHNIAHVCYETLDLDGGAAFLDAWLAGYDRRAPYRCHLAWHLALFELHRGDAARALAIHERDIAASSNARHAVMDGAALLWRLLLYGGAPSPLPWRPIAALAAQVARPSFVFGEIHAALAYAAAGDQAPLAAMIDSLQALDARGHPIAGAVALPLVRGIAAFAAGDHAGALAHLASVDGQIHRMGGSHAQWEIFEETMVVCLLELGRHGEAVALLRRRLRRRPTPRDLAWLDRAERGAGARPGTPAPVSPARPR